MCWLAPVKPNQIDLALYLFCLAEAHQTALSRNDGAPLFCLRHSLSLDLRSPAPTVTVGLVAADGVAEPNQVCLMTYDSSRCRLSPNCSVQGGYFSVLLEKLRDFS
jgi:hypothetical protein